MKKIETFLRSKETYNKVLEALSKYGNLKELNSSTPYIAGGSVANVLISFVYGGEPVINDIDVYNQASKEYQHSLLNSDNPRFTSQNLNLVADGYDRTYVSNKGAKVTVVSHKREGFFNIVDFVFSESNKEDYALQVIIDGFDLNCCSVGLDLGKEEIVFSNTFVEFLETKQLKVTSPNSPLHTAIRLFKKIEDLNCFCDLEHEMRFLTATKKWVKSNYEMSSIIGPETLLKYEKYKDKVEKYFVIRETNQDDNLFGQKIPEGMMAFDAVMPFNTVEQANSVSEMKRIWNLLYRPKTKSEQNKINKIFYKNVFLNNDKEDRWYTIPASQSGLVYQSGYTSYRFTYQALLGKTDYHKCNFDVKHVEVVDKFADEHVGIRILLSKFDTLAEQYKLIKDIKSIANKEGDWIIGSLETYNWNDYFSGRVISLNKEQIQKIVDETKINDSKELTEKVNLTGFEHSGCVTELNTTLDLKKEGYKMGHCVGGYSSKVKGGFSRIFHIDCDGIGSTVEISLPITGLYFKNLDNLPQTESKIKKPLDDWKFKKVESAYQSFNGKKCFAVSEDGQEQEIRRNQLIFNCSQHFGRYPEKGNKLPTDTNKMIVNKLINFLNQNHLPKNYNISVEDLEIKEESDIFVF